MVYSFGVTDQEATASVLTRGFDRRRYAITLAVATVLVAAFMWLDVNRWHGLGALITLGLASWALVYAGGPADRARRITAGPQALEIERWTRVRTRVAWVELDGVTVVADQAGAGLLLIPRDPLAFFEAHPELRDVATADGALVPLGRRAGVGDDVRAALAARDAD